MARDRGERKSAGGDDDFESHVSPIHSVKAVLHTEDDCGYTDSTGDGFGDLFFCQICQKDLTHMSITCRAQHMNSCCENAAENEEEDGENIELEEGHACLLCKRKFKARQVRSPLSRDWRYI